jgi:D-alanyl-D-alanine carboxypeptidase
VTGESYPDELRRLVGSRLGLGRTYLSSLPALETPTLHGYAPDPPNGFDDATNLVDFGGWAWASGGVVSTPANMNDFVRGYVGGDLYRGIPRRAQFYGLIAGGHSEPRGPGKNAAGMALFRYRTRCGTVFGHTGSILGYTQFIAATRDGRRSVTFTITSQYDDGLLPALRRAEEKAVCAALA